MFAANLLESTEFFVAVGLLVAALFLGAILIYATDRWRKRRERSAASTGQETLSMYRELMRRGEISPAEYQAIRERIAKAARGSPADETPTDLAELDHPRAISTDPEAKTKNPE